MCGFPAPREALSSSELLAMGKSFPLNTGRFMVLNFKQTSSLVLAKHGNSHPILNPHRHDPAVLPIHKPDTSEAERTPPARVILRSSEDAGREG